MEVAFEADWTAAPEVAAFDTAPAGSFVEMEWAARLLAIGEEVWSVAALTSERPFEVEMAVVAGVVVIVERRVPRVVERIVEVVDVVEQVGYTKDVIDWSTCSTPGETLLHFECVDVLGLGLC